VDDELQDDQLEADGDNEDATSGSDNSAPPEKAPAPKDESKRINDLMSKWQTEKARADRLEAAQAASSKGGDQQDGGTGSDAELDEFKDFAREYARNQLFASDPRLAQAGIEAEDIVGTTLAEMQASFKKHLKVVGGIESRLRNKILAEHGLDPDVATGAGTEKTPSFTTMSDKDFAAFMAERDARGR
jgi:hypothetical protein